MTTLRDALLPALDAVRAIPGALGLSEYAVTVRVRTWSGSALAGGMSSDADTAVLPGGQNPRVRRVAYREVVAAGGKYQEGDYRIGPLTPDFTTGSGGGVAFATLAPPQGSSPTEVFWKLVGPDTPTDGQWCSTVQVEADNPLHRYVVVRPMGVVP